MNLRITKTLLTMVSIMALSSAFATDYYMATNGNNANSGTLASPFASLHAFNNVAQPGDVLYVRGGTYVTYEVILKASGTAGNPITIRNYPGETPILDGNRNDPNATVNGIVIDDGVWGGVPGQKNYWTFDGLVMRNWKRAAFWIGGDDSNADNTANEIIAHHITIRNCLTDLCGQNGVTMHKTDHILIENCVMGRTGWDVGVGSWSSTINIIETSGKNHIIRNTAAYHAVDVSGYHTDGNGFILDAHGTNDAYDGAAQLDNCLFFKNGGAGVAWTKQHNAYINNCTFYDNAKDPSYIKPGFDIVLYHQKKQTNINLRNNIMPGGIKVETYGYSGAKNNNLIKGESGYADPKYKNTGASDFSLQSSSPAINAGTSSGGVPSTSIGLDPKVFKNNPNQDQYCAWWDVEPDFDYVTSIGGVANLFSSVSRPQGGAFDIGAFEYSGTITPPTGGGTTYQAEANTSTDCGNSQSTHAGYTGTGYMDYGSYVEWNNVSPGSGTYSISLRYANGSTSNRTCEIIVNGTNRGTATFNPTGGWANWGTSTVIGVPLNAGNNTVRVRVKSGFAGPNLDKMDLTLSGGGGSGDTPSTAKIQAENGTLTGAVSAKSTIPGREGSHVGSFTTNGDQVTVGFTNVVAGAYNLNIRYQAWGAQQNNVLVNGTSTDTNFPATGNAMGTKTVSVTLNAGNNTIGIRKGWGYMDVDYFQIVPSGARQLVSESLNNQSNAESAFSIYPVPSDGKVNFTSNFTENTKLTIYDSSGSLVDQRELAAKAQFSLNLKSGLYFANFKLTSGQEVARKLIVR